MDPKPEFLLPEVVKDKVDLILLSPGSKNPVPGVSWPEALYPYDSQVVRDWVANGGNYGVVPRKGLLIIDADSEEMGKIIFEGLPDILDTFCVQGRPKHAHIYLDCVDATPGKVILMDGDKDLGDFRGGGSNFYIVGPGSIHPDTKEQYKVKNTDTLVDVAYQEILTLFDPYIKKPKVYVAPMRVGGRSISDRLGLRITDFIQVFGSGEVRLTHPIEGSSQKNLNFSVNTQKNTWFCYHHNVGGDPFSWVFYANCNGDEGSSPRTADEVKTTLEWLKSNGYRKEVEEMEKRELEAWRRTQSAVKVVSEIVEKALPSDIPAKQAAYLKMRGSR